MTTRSPRNVWILLFYRYIPYTVGLQEHPPTSIHLELNIPLWAVLFTITFSLRFGCLVNSVGLSKVAARRGGGSVAGWTGTDRRAAGTGPSVWRETRGTLNVSPKSRRNLEAQIVDGVSTGTATKETCP